MIKLKTLTLAALLACVGCSLKVKGQWDADLPGHFIASTPLEPQSEYIIRNNTPEDIDVWLLDDRTPLWRFLVMSGEVRRFTSPGDSFDLHTYSNSANIPVSLWWLPD